MTTLPDKIRVMRAAHARFPIECLDSTTNTWQPSDPTWNWRDSEYRVAKYKMPIISSLEECTAEIEKMMPLTMAIAVKLVDLHPDIVESYVGVAEKLVATWQSFKYTGN